MIPEAEIIKYSSLMNRKEGVKDKFQLAKKVHRKLGKESDPELVQLQKELEEINGQLAGIDLREVEAYRWKVDWHSRGTKKEGVGDRENWIYSGKIKIYEEGRVIPICLDLVCLGVQDMLSDIGLPFKIEKAGKTGSDSKIDPNCGAVIITDRYCTGEANWGVTSHFGKTFLQFPGKRQNSNFCRQLTKHEMGHFLNFNINHHDSTGPNGYREPKDCLMYWRASTSNLCGKCRDAIIYFWKGIEEATGRKFLSPLQARL
jgi:hypothetical protein